MESPTTATANNEDDEGQRRLALENLMESLMPGGTRRFGPTGPSTYRFLDAAALPANSQTGERKDVEFAVGESQMRFDWSKAGMVVLRHFSQDPIKYMIQTVNFVGDVPKFLDWEYCPSDVDYYALTVDGDSRRRDIASTRPSFDRRRDMASTRPSFDRWIRQIQDELSDAEWHRQPSPTPSAAAQGAVSTTTVSPDPKQAALGLRSMWDCYRRTTAKVLAFRTDRGDRLEYWTEVHLTKDGAAGYEPTFEHAYIILQTVGGKVLILGQDACHPFVICNLLRFINSDGSTADVSSTISLEETEGAKVLKGLLELAPKYLFGQSH